MTDIDKICHKLAEQICDNITDYGDYPSMRKNDIELIYNVIRNHTVAPEMVSMLEVVEHELSQPLSGKTVLGSQIRKLLVKARGVG